MHHQHRLFDTYVWTSYELVYCVFALLLWVYQCCPAKNTVSKSLGVIFAGVSPSTTLVMTDIEGSTMLWETIDMSVMDIAIYLHHQVIRDCVARFRGYESATGGLGCCWQAAVQQIMLSLA